MEQLRFDDSFTYDICVDDDIDPDDMLIPSLMIQPLVENAIWHGLMQVEGEKKIGIAFTLEGNLVKCIIEDNGIGIAQSEKNKAASKNRHQSVGLENLRKRIKIINGKYDANCSLVINDRKDLEHGKRGTLVVLRLNIITT
jgi:sensor histidine kinase YesM